MKIDNPPPSPALPSLPEAPGAPPVFGMVQGQKPQSKGSFKTFINDSTALPTSGGLANKRLIGT